MGINVASNFTVNAALPLDDRIQVADNTARDALDAGRRYEGLIVYVIAAGTNYQLIGGILNANWQELSGGGAGTTVIVQRFSGDASTVLFTLSNDPIAEENTQIYINGVYQQKDTYSVSGTAITFSAAPPIGTSNIEVTYFTAFSVASLPVGSVNTLQLADNAVTESKIADNAVTPAKLSAVNLQSVAISSYLNNTTSYTLAATLTITTNGRPLEWGFYNDGSVIANNSMVAFGGTTSSLIGLIKIENSSGPTILSEQRVGASLTSGFDSSNSVKIQQGPLGLIEIASGTYTFDLYAKCEGANSSIQFINTRFFVREL